jgi:type VI secretion system protein ImpH
MTSLEILSALESEPYTFSFFQAVRLLERISAGRERVGEFAPPSREAVRFGANPTTAFPASEVHSITWNDEGKPPQMLVNFLGLTGPLGTLPLYYTELLIARLRERDTTLADFLDLFNHRVMSLFYGAWRKYRFTVAYERGEQEGFSQHLLALIGLGTPGLQKRLSVPDDTLTFYAGLLSPHPRSAIALKQLLNDYFEVPVDIVQFAGSWYPLERPTQCCLDDTGTPSEQLGLGAVVGDEIFDHQSVIRLRLGPLKLEQYLDFLPGRRGNQSLRALTQFFSGNEIDFEAQLILEKDEVPPCELGREDSTAPMLGWLTWAKSKPLERDANQTILRLR